MINVNSRHKIILRLPGSLLMSQLNLMLTIELKH